LIEDRYGYYYETKTNEYQGKKPVRLRINKESATQAYYSYQMGQPATAKSSKARLFGDLYESIFNNDELDVDVLFFAYKLLEALKTLNNNPEIVKYSFYKDALLTVLALLKDYSTIKNIDALEKDEKTGYSKLRKDYVRILEKAQLVVDEEIEKVGSDGFEKRRFFIAPSTLGRIHEKLLK
jgi:hypothetical protein